MRFLFVLALSALTSQSHAAVSCHDIIQGMVKLEYTLVNLDPRVANDRARGAQLMPVVLAYADVLASPAENEDCHINVFREFVSLSYAAAPFEAEDRLAGLIISATAATPGLKVYVDGKSREFLSSYTDHPTAACRVPLLQSRIEAQLCNLSAPEKNSCFDKPFNFNECLRENGVK